MKKIINKNERYIKTFIETFFAYIAIKAVETDLTNKEALKGLIIGAVASALSVIVNIEKKEKTTTELSNRDLKRLYGEVPVIPDEIETAPITHEEGEIHE